MGIKGDFLGFTFADTPSDELNIIRISDGDRYEEELQPEISDITAEVPGMDGMYYFGSTFGKKSFSISIAFDSVTEEQFRKIRKLFGRKNQGYLVFDERPYKKYMVKIENPIELSYICFDEPKKDWTTIDGIRYKEDDVYKTEHEVLRPTEGTERIYKGEGKIDFIAYFPFAKSCYKELPFTYEQTSDIAIQENKKYFVFVNNQFSLVSNPVQSQLNLYYERVINEEANDWVISSGILSADERETYGIDEYQNGVINVYNAGDIPTGFRLYIPVAAASQEITLTYRAAASNVEDIAQLVINPVEIKDGDMGILIDTNNGLIVGVRQAESIIDQDGNATYQTSGNLYNEYVKSGYFFKFQPNESVTDGATLQIDNGAEGIQIFYDYLYF